MKCYRKFLNQMDEQTGPIWFVLGFHTIIHILGIYATTQLPYSWNLGVESKHVAVPAFSLVAFISVLSLIWASLRFYALRQNRLPMLFLILIPVVMSLGTLVYARTTTKCVALGRVAIESEIESLNQRIERFKNNPHRKHWEIEERDRLLEELK